jgi:type 1 fimbria pilin
MLGWETSLQHEVRSTTSSPISRKGERREMISLKKLFALVAIISACAFAAVTGNARADSATVYQQSCSIVDTSGTGLAVFLGNDTLALTSCHTADRSSEPLVIKSGNCTTVGDMLNVCAGNRP